MGNINGKITRPIGVSDVKSVLGSASNDVGTLCRNENVNKWSKYKPVKCAGLVSLASVSEWQNIGWGLEIPTAFLNITGDILEHRDSTWRYNKPSGGEESPYRLSDFEHYAHYAPQFVKASSIPGTIASKFFSVSYDFNQDADNGGLIPSDLKIAKVTSTSVKDLYVGFALYRSTDSFADGKLAFLFTSQTKIGTSSSMTIPSMMFSRLETGKYIAMLFLSAKSYTYGATLPTTLPSDTIAIIEGGISEVIIETSDMNVGTVLWGRAVKVSAGSRPNTEYYSVTSGSNVFQDGEGYWYVGLTPSGGGLVLMPSVANLNELNDLRRRITMEPLEGSVGWGQYNPMADGRDRDTLTIGLFKYSNNVYDGLLVGLRYTLYEKTQDAQTKNWTYRWKRSIVVVDLDASGGETIGEFELGIKFECMAVVQNDGQVASFSGAEIDMLRVANMTDGSGDSQTLRGLHIYVKGNRKGNDYDELNYQIWQPNINILDTCQLSFNPSVDIAGYYRMPYGNSYVDVTVDTMES